MRRIVFLLILLGATTSWASDFVCGDPTTLHQYWHAIDPSRVPACPPQFLLSEIPEAEIPTQRTLYDSVPKRHIKVVAGLMVEMTQAEKDAVDAPLLEEADKQEEMIEETEDPELCGIDELDALTQQMTAIRAQIQTDIDAVTSDVAVLKRELGEIFDRVMTTFEKTTRCLLAARRTKR